MYKNDKKTEVFTKISYINDTKESEMYKIYSILDTNSMKTML